MVGQSRCDTCLWLPGMSCGAFTLALDGDTPSTVVTPAGMPLWSYSDGRSAEPVSVPSKNQTTTNRYLMVAAKTRNRLFFYSCPVRRQRGQLKSSKVEKNGSGLWSWSVTCPFISLLDRWSEWLAILGKPLKLPTSPCPTEGLRGLLLLFSCM